MSDIVLIILFIGLPLLIPLVGFLWLRRKGHWKRDAAAQFYSFVIGGSRILVSKKTLLMILLWGLPIFWFEMLLPLPIVPLIIAIVLISVFRNRPHASAQLGEQGRQLLDSLKGMQTQISAAVSHVHALATEVQSRQIELEEKEKLRTTLQQDIDTKLREVEAWQGLSDEQKALFIAATKDAITSRTALQSVTVIIGSIAVNLVASVVWALMGAPGKDQLISLFTSFKTILGR